MQEIYFISVLGDTNSMLFLVGAPTAGGGAQWTNQPPSSIQTRDNHPAPYRAIIHLPAGGSLGVSYKRTSVTPEAHVNIKIEYVNGALQVTTSATDANQLNVSARQNDVPDNVQIVMNFTGK